MCLCIIAVALCYISKFMTIFRGPFCLFFSRIVCWKSHGFWLRGNFYLHFVKILFRFGASICPEEIHHRCVHVNVCVPVCHRCTTTNCSELGFCLSNSYKKSLDAVNGLFCGFYLFLNVSLLKLGDWESNGNEQKNHRIFFLFLSILIAFQLDCQHFELNKVGKTNQSEI